MTTIDKTICDRCNNYEVTPSGVTEICHQFRQVNGISPIIHFDKYYIEKRFNGEVNNCKQFKTIRK